MRIRRPCPDDATACWRVDEGHREHAGARFDRGGSRVFVACLTAFATRNHDVGLTLAGLAAVIIGLVWLAVEHRRVRGIEKRWSPSIPTRCDSDPVVRTQLTSRDIIISGKVKIGSFSQERAKASIHGGAPRTCSVSHPF